MDYFNKEIEDLTIPDYSIAPDTAIRNEFKRAYSKYHYYEYADRGYNAIASMYWFQRYATARKIMQQMGIQENEYIAVN